MRGALFNTLGDIVGLSVLDPFGGTGAISFEAISRGAKNSILIERDKRAFENIRNNIKILGTENLVKAIRANASGWSDNNPAQKFNLLLMDPPYDNLQVNIINKLISRHLKKSGIAVLSHPVRFETPNFDFANTLTIKNYGDGQLAFYRKTS